jgi:hypothetical protein
MCGDSPTAGLGEGQAVETSSSDGGEGEEGGEGDGVASSLSTKRRTRKQELTQL